MKYSNAAVGAALLAGLFAAASAHATNLVTNGSFESDSLGTAHEFGADWIGQTVDGWTSASNTAFNVYFPVDTAVGPVNANTQYSEYGQFLHVLPANADPDGGAFVALDGDPAISGALTQTLNNLTIGQKYSVSFDWAAAQYYDRSGDTTEQLQVGFGTQTQSTAVVSNLSEGATDWVKQTFTFTAQGTSQVLSFLSIGTPSGMPPVALLDGVSVSPAPEPATWAMMLAGLAGLGGAVRMARRAKPATATSL